MAVRAAATRLTASEGSHGPDQSHHAFYCESRVLFRQDILEGIQQGHITLAFRRWRRPTVRSGGRLRTAAGELQIIAVAPVTLDDITEADARSAGYDSRAVLVAELTRRPEGELYRIELGGLRLDPRVTLRSAAHLTPAEQHDVVERLARLDDKSPDGPWTRRVLRLIAEQPATRAGSLCSLVGMAQPRFKTNVRKLKELGLTESLEVGYQLSPRGRSVLRWLES